MEYFYSLCVIKFWSFWIFQSHTLFIRYPRDLVSPNHRSLDKMISKFPGMWLHIQAEGSRGANAVSLSTHRRAKEDFDRPSIRVSSWFRERRALTIAVRRDWNWESSGQPRRLESRNTVYEFGNRFLLGIYIVHVSPRNKKLSTE